MTNKTDRNRLAPAQRRALFWAAAAFVACLAMNIYHYSLQGARGLYVWHSLSLFRILILMGLIPGTLVFISFPLEKLGGKKTAARIVRGTALAAALLVILASLGISAFLFAGPRLGSLEPARLTLINPAEGISRRASSDAAFSAGDSAAPEGAPVTAKATASAAAQGSPAGGPAPAASSKAPAEALLRLSVSSDPHWGVDTANAAARSEILASVAEHRPDAFFILGDLTETGAKAWMWNSALADLEAIVPKVPVRPLLGNHDALFGGQYLFKKAFFPASFKSDSGSPYYYAIDAGAATIVVLNLPWGTENYGARQRAWLERTLKAADPAKPIIALSHSYFYASGYDDPEFGSPWYDHYQNIPAITPLFEKYGVDLVISGHNHYQEYLEHGAIRYAVIGAMGGIPDPEPVYVSPASKWIAVATFGRLDVDIFPAEVVLSFRDAPGALLHQERFAY